ncbi:MAG TPA: helix-turn-helix transcriptional regulator [Blastocatellia bacterium]|nr:helix-turn-helix transcriptional regulator [Blastocatellia bacterium]
MTSPAPAEGVGNLLRNWRMRRRLSQLELACQAQISTRHLSFVETGRAQPSREMILRIADGLEIPLRDRNVLLVRAGYAAMFPERQLSAPELEAALEAVDMVLKGHEPYPGIAVDRHWTLVRSNNSIGRLLTDLDPALLTPPVNVLRLSLHPKGLAPRIENFAEWRTALLARVSGQVERAGDPVLKSLFDEVNSYPAPVAGGARSAPTGGDGDHAGVVLPLKMITEFGVLSLFGTTTIFGTPLDVTLSEIALEMFFPADRATREILLSISKPD